MKRKRRLIAAAVCTAVILTSCVGSDLIPAESNATVRFSWWIDDIQNTHTSEGVEQFVRMNPDIDVFTDFTEHDNYSRYMTVNYAAGSAPDVMQLDYSLMCRLSSFGTGFYDLNDLSENIDLSTFSQDDLDYGTVDGKLIGIPISLDAETVFYNQDIYVRYGLDLPQNWNDLFRAARVMRSNGVYPLQMDRTAAWLACIAYQEQNTGKRCFDREGGLQFEESDFLEMLTFYKSMIDEKVVKPYSEVDEQDLLSGVSAGVLCWISEAERRCQPLIDNGASIVIGSYPRSTGSMILGWYAKPTSLYCIKKNTVRPAEAAKLVNFLVNSQEMAQLQGTDRGIPLSRAMLEVLESHNALSGLKVEANRRMSSSKDIDRIGACYEDDLLMAAFDRAVDGLLGEERGDPAELAAELYAAAEAASVKG